MKKTVIAVIGCGRIANNAHFPAFAKMENIRVKYACDIIKEKAEAAKEKFDFVEQVITDYRVALEDGEVELIASADIPSRRGDLAVRSMRSGHHFFVDKAPVITLSQLDEVIKAKNETGKKYFVY